MTSLFRRLRTTSGCLVLAAVAVAVAAMGPGVTSPALAQTVPSAGSLVCTGPAGDPAPGTPAFQIRDAQNAACTQNRRADDTGHPTAYQRAGLYGADPYRVPARHAGSRFRFDTLSIGGLEAEVYRPCTASTCTDVPPGVGVFDEGPYPVAIVLHGFLSDKRHLWWASEPLAEEGYFVVAVNGTGGAIPNQVLTWLNGPAQALYPGQIDVTRVGIAGHSLGAENSTSTQGDPRVSAIVAWDPCSSPNGCEGSRGSTVGADPTHRTPTLYVTAEYKGFPGYPQQVFTSVPDTLRVSGATTLRARGVDSMLVTLRASTHLDFAQAYVNGNQLAEAATAHYNLAWFDRYVKGKYVVGQVAPDADAAERASRQAIARSGYERLIASTFDDSSDRHNISAGVWDPVLAATSGDPEYGGNVPYSIAGMPVADRLSFYFRSTCFVSSPDYTAAAGDALTARADSTPDGNLRQQGCPVVFDKAGVDPVVPEGRPVALVVLAIGGAGLLVLARRRRSAGAEAH